MENNITAVQFIKEQIGLDSDTSFFNIDWNKFDKIIEKAKKIEKEIIRKAYLDGRDNEYATSKDYYNENYKSE